MILKIFLDDKSFYCLKHAVPAGSRSKLLLHDPAHLSIVGNTTVIICDEAEARNLLLYASHCPVVIASIHDALRSAGLSLETPEKLAIPGPRRLVEIIPVKRIQGYDN